MGLFGKTKTTLVADIAAVLKSKGVRGRAAPRQQIQVLRSFSRLVQREKLNVTGVLAGSPLEQVPHNGMFEGVRVRYAKNDAALAKELQAALRQAGSGGVLVTDDADLEKRTLRSGGLTLRVSTLRKVLDDGNEPSGDNRPRPPRRERDRDRDRGPRQERGPRPDRDPKPEQPEAEGGEEERAISQMIDLVE